MKMQRAFGAADTIFRNSGDAISPFFCCASGFPKILDNVRFRWSSSVFVGHFLSLPAAQKM